MSRIRIVTWSTAALLVSCSGKMVVDDSAADDGTGGRSASDGNGGAESVAGAAGDGPGLPDYLGMGGMEAYCTPGEVRTCFASCGAGTWTCNEDGDGYGPCGCDGGGGGEAGSAGGAGGCATEFADCNANPEDGCETDLGNDADNCGACDRACAPSWSCFRGKCLQVLAEDQDSPLGLEVDATDVYWVNWGTRDALGNHNQDGAIVRLPVAGNVSSTLADGLNEPRSMALDDTHVYWIERGNGGQVRKIPIEGGTPISLAADRGSPIGVVVDETHVYWMELADPLSGDDDVIVRVAKDGTDLTTIVSARTNDAGPFAVGSGYVYWHDPVSGFMKASVDGSAGPVEIAGGGETVESLAVSDTELFWTDNTCSGTSDAAKVAVEGGQVVTLARVPGCNPSDMVLDGPNLYWLMSNGPDDDWESGRVVRTPRDPGESVILIDGQDAPWAVAVDDTYVYWASLDDESGLGSVLRMAK